MKSLLLTALLAIPAFSMYENKPKPAEEKCEWRKIRRHHPRKCVTESGLVCPAERCNAAKKSKPGRP
jgi:hypothetical protein